MSHSLYKTYREIWEDRLKVLSEDPNLLSENAFNKIKAEIKTTQEEIQGINDNSEESQLQKKSLQSFVKSSKERLEKNVPLFKEIQSLPANLDSPKADELHIPTQVKSAPTLGLKTLEISSGHEHNPALSLTQNVDSAMKAWSKLKRHCEQTYRPGTWSLAACSHIAYVYSQEFDVEI
jgi:hypothetical protein